MWPEEEIEDLLCDVTCVVVTVNLRVLEVIVVMTSKVPINLFTNPNPRLSH
jgi:hypothetical protein